MANAAKYIGYVVGVAVVAFFVWLVFRVEQHTGDADEVVVVRYDTIQVVQRDTLRLTKIVQQEKYYYDTVVVRDTVYIADIPQVYEDSTADYLLRVQAVKMYDYSLEIFRVDSCTTIVPITQEMAKKRRSRAKWGQSVTVGVQVGYGMGIQPTTMRASFEPYVGVGVTYGFGVTW